MKQSRGSTEYVPRSCNALPGNLWLGFAVVALEVEVNLLVQSIRPRKKQWNMKSRHKCSETESFLFFLALKSDGLSFY